MLLSWVYWLRRQEAAVSQQAHCGYTYYGYTYHGRRRRQWRRGILWLYFLTYVLTHAQGVVQPGGKGGGGRTTVADAMRAACSG